MRKPLYFEVANEIRSRINEGVFKPGEKFSSEHELARIFGVSRGTLREALTSLEMEGLVSRKHGKGVFVNNNAGKIAAGVESLESLTGTISRSGHLAEDKVLSLTQVNLDEEKAGCLDLEPGAPAFEIESLRLSDSEPVIYCYDLVPGKVANNSAGLIELRRKCDSLVQFLDKYTVYNAKQYVSTINAVLPPAKIARLLNISANMPMIYLEGIMYDEKGEAINYGYQYFRSDKYQFNLVRKR